MLELKFHRSDVWLHHNWLSQHARQIIVTAFLLYFLNQISGGGPGHEPVVFCYKIYKASFIHKEVNITSFYTDLLPEKTPRSRPFDHWHFFHSPPLAPQTARSKRARLWRMGLQRTTLAAWGRKKTKRKKGI